MADQLSTLSQMWHGKASIEELLPLLRQQNWTGSRSRLILNVAEKLLYSEFESETDRNPSHVAELLKELLPNAPKCRGVWFGGRTKCSTGSEDREKWAASLLLGCSLIEEEDELTVLILEKVEKEFWNAGEFAHRMSGQDDRLLSILSVLLQLKEQLGNNKSLNYFHVILHVLAEIGFNYQTVLDWLTSELISLKFLSSFLEDLTINLAAWKLAAIKVKSQRESHHYMSFMQGSWIENQPEEKREDDVVLRLGELAGLTNVQKEIRIGRKEPTRIFVRYEVEISEEDYFTRLYDMLVRLRLRLEALAEKSLGNYSHLIRQIEEFEDLADGDNSFNMESDEDSEMSD